ncbi:uncharacterized protein WCC33_010326 [Rhinophrynus dorsalis]
MGSSKQLTEDQKIKIIDSYKAGEGYKKISKRYLLAVSTVRNVIKKWKLLGTVEVKTRSGRPRKISDKTARRLVRKAKQNPHITVKDLQESLAGTGVVVHQSTVQRCLHKHDPHGRVLKRKPCIRTPEESQCLAYAAQRLAVLEAFWNQVVLSNEVKTEHSDNNHQRDLREHGEDI